MTALTSRVRPIAENRRARHHYTVLERFDAGIVLQGTEIKSLRHGKAQLADSYCLISPEGEVEWVGGQIPPYGHGNQHNHDPSRRRKLLLHRQQIKRLYGKVREKNMTLVPLRLYFSGPWVKLEIALAQGKTLHDKRRVLRERQLKRDIEGALRIRQKRGEA